MKFLKLYEDYIDDMLPEDYPDGLEPETVQDYDNAIDTMKSKIESGEITEEELERGKKIMDKVKAGKEITEEEFEFGMAMADKIDSEEQQEHLDRAAEYVADQIENEEIEGTQEEVEEILRTMGGMRIPFSGTKAEGGFADKLFDKLVSKFAEKVLALAKEKLSY